MKEFTQLELLDESLWSTIGKGGRLLGGIAAGTAQAAGRTLDKVAPELTQPWKNLAGGIKDIVAPSSNTMFKIWQGRVNYIIGELKDMGYVVKSPNKIKKSGRNYVVPAFKIISHDASGTPILDKKASPFLVDRSGTILKNLRNAKPSASLRQRRNP